MDDEEEVGLEREHDPLAQPAHAGDAAPFRVRDRRIDGTEHEGADEAHPLERLARRSALERLDVDRDVGKFRHRSARCGYS